MKSTPNVILELRQCLNLPVLRKDDEVLRTYRYLLARAIIICDFSQSIPTEHEDVLHEAHKLLRDTIALIFSDSVVEAFDERAKAEGRESLMEIAQQDSRILVLGELSVKSLKGWDVLL